MAVIREIGWIIFLILSYIQEIQIMFIDENCNFMYIKLNQLVKEKCMTKNARWMYAQWNHHYDVLETVYSYSVFRKSLEKTSMIGSADNGLRLFGAEASKEP